MTKILIDAAVVQQALDALEVAKDTTYSFTDHAQFKKATQELHTAIEQAEVDDFDSPEYWRGHDEAVQGVATRWEQALTQPIPAPGVMNEPLESLYRKTEELRTAIEAGEKVEQIDPCTKGWLAAMSDAYHSHNTTAHTKEKLLEILQFLATPPAAEKEPPPCKTHPDAPHGFLRGASHTEGRYVCECEYWEPEPPAEREWVELADTDIRELRCDCGSIPICLIFEIEAKLKEKNGG